jgi:hypothetical protein
VRRTAQTIAEQQARDPQTSGERSASKPVNKAGNQRGMHPNSLAAIREHVFPAGTSGNPGGRTKDVASALARKIIEDSIEESYEGFRRKLASGDAYAFSVLSDRGFGKLKQGIIHTGDDEGGPINANITVRFVKPDGQ